MIPTARILDKIRRTQGISRVQVISLLQTGDKAYQRAVAKLGPPLATNRLIAYAHLLNFKEHEIDAIVEYNNRYRQFKAFGKLANYDLELMGILASILTMWPKVPADKKLQMNLDITKALMPYLEMLPISFINVLYELNNADRS